jgi:hypothetical protein
MLSCRKSPTGPQRGSQGGTVVVTYYMLLLLNNNANGISAYHGNFVAQRGYICSPHLSIALLIQRLLRGGYPRAPLCEYALTTSLAGYSILRMHPPRSIGRRARRG